MDFISLLKAECDFDTSLKGKYVKHADSNYDLRKLWLDGKIELYQAFQGRDVFNCDYIISFIGEGNDKARFIGIYDVISKKNAKDCSLSEEEKAEVFAGEANFFYELKKRPGYEKLENSVIISWGGSQQWHHRVDNTTKEVWQIYPSGFYSDFPGTEKIMLSFSELCFILKNKEANKDWYATLSNLNGVYLILDKLTGKQYIGSAYGHEGIWGRWTEYMNTNGTGNNKQLEELISEDSNYAIKNFQYTLLRALPKALTKDQVIAQEAFLKNCLGARAFGLNSN